MNIVVCIKSVPATAEAKFNKEANTMVRETVKNEINPFDMYAIEEALRIKEQVGGKVTILSMGIPTTADLLREALSMGADEAFLLSDPAFAGSDSLATSYALSMGLRYTGNYNLIICGKQTIDGDTGQVGPGLAEKLGIPHTTNVRKIDEIRIHYIKVQRLVEGGIEVVEMLLPSLITVVKEINNPRFPSIKGIIKSKSAEINILSADDIKVDKSLCGLKGSPTRVVKTFTSQYNVKSEIIEGQPEEQAKKLVKKLIENGIHLGI